MKTTIYMVRHCESEGNACRRSHALFDGIVTRKGLEQAEVLAQRFADIPVTAVYSSDAYRSRMTAEPLAKAKNLPVQYRLLLREYTIGAWEGLSIGYTANRFPELYATWLTELYNPKIPGADPFPLIAERGYMAIQRIAAENPGGTVVAITHSCTLTCALTKVLGQPISYYTSIKSGDNTAVTKLEVDEKGNIEAIYINDDSHLPEHLLRKNYTGRSAATNFDFRSIDDGQEANFAEISEKMCQEFPALYTAESLETAAKTADIAIVATLPDRPCGLATMGKRDFLPADHGLVETLFVVGDLRYKGYCEQLFGEAIDLLRRRGCRYLVLENTDEPHAQLMLDRFCFEPLPGDDRYMRMAITVPGLEGPVY